MASVAPPAPVPSESSRMIGAVLNGRWRLTRVLGEGGMGAVFAADAQSGGVVAVKMLHPEFRADPNVTSRFFTEAQSMSRLIHPGIVRVFDAANAEDGSPYIVMELLEGQTLAAVLAPRRPLPPKQVTAITTRMLEAIGFAHAAGIVHRDLKPENVFVAPLGEADASVKIVDFGLAKVMDAAGGMGSRTRTGMLLGTPGYMSPEQIANARSVDPRSDLFSIAIMLFEMLTGQDPYPADNPFERITKVLISEPPRVSTAQPGLAGLDPFFTRALARKPEDRFGTAHEMATALITAMAGGQIEAQLINPAALPRPQHSTKVSELGPVESQAPRTTDALAVPLVQVVAPAPLPPPAKSLWPLITLVASLVCLAVGVLIGYLIAHA